MRRFLIAVSCMVALTLTGCWSRRELTEISITGMLGLDWEEGQYLVTVNVLSPRSGGGESGSGGRQQGVWTISERAPALDQAFAKLDQILSRSLTLAHVRGIIFGEELARKGIGHSMDLMLRSVEIRPTAWVGVTNGRAADLLMARPRQEMAVSDGPIGYHDAANRRSSVTPARRLTEVANILQEEGVDLSLPLFRLAGSDPPDPEGALEAHPESPQEVVYGGSAIFRSDKMVDWISPADTRGLLWSRDRAVHGAVSAPCESPQERVVYRLRKGDGEVKTFLVGGKPRGLIKVRVKADINEIGCTEDVFAQEEVHALERMLQKEVHSQIDSAVEHVRSTGSDFFGFGQALFRWNPDAYHQMAKRWPETLKEMPVDIEVTAQVPRLGQLNQNFRWNDK